MMFVFSDALSYAKIGTSTHILQSLLMLEFPQPYCKPARGQASANNLAA